MTIFVPITSGPIALVGVARPRPERAAALKALLTSFVAPTRREPGSMHYLLHDDEHGNLVFYFYEYFDSGVVGSGSLLHAAPEKFSSYFHIINLTSFWPARILVAGR